MARSETSPSSWRGQSPRSKRNTQRLGLPQKEEAPRYFPGFSFTSSYGAE